MEDYRDYRCPRECPGRSKDCHIACERHEKYRDLNEQRKKAAWDDKIMPERAFVKKLR